MANVKITELPANTNPSWKEEFVYARSNSNGKMTLDTIKKFVWNWGWGWGSGTRTDEIFAPGTLPDSRESNTWIFTSNWMHWVEFVWNQAKVYAMATAFDIDWENTLLTTVTAPGDINMWLLNDEWTRLILLWYKSSWRIMYWINFDDGWEAFMFDPNSSEYTYNGYENRWEQVPYFKSTTDLASWDYDNLSIYSNVKWENVPFSDLKFIGMCYNNLEYRYVYYPETDEYGQIVVWVADWNNPGEGQAWPNLERTRITAILDLSDWQNGPTYMYWDPLQAWADWWYKVVNYSSAYRPNYPDSEDQFFADWNWSIWTINDNTQFIWWNQKYISSDRYLWYNTTKQIVTQYNVKWYGNPEPDDTINVPSFYRFNNEIGNLQNGKQNKLSWSPEFISHKATKTNPTPWIETEEIFANGIFHSVSFYQNWTIALLSSAYTCYCWSVANPYKITEQEIIDIYNTVNHISIDDSLWQAFLSEDWYKLIAKVTNSSTIRVYNLDTPFDLTSSQTVDSYDVGVDWYIFNYDWTALWKWEYDENDDHDYWNLYTWSNYEYDQFTFQGHQWDIDFTGNWNYLSCIALSFDWEYLIAWNLGGSWKWIVLYKLSTPFDLSTATLFQTLKYEDWNFRNCYCWIPTEDFVYVAWRNSSHQDQQIRKYWYNPSIAYPSMEIIYSEPVTATPDNGVITLENPITVVDWQSWNITLKATTDTTKLFPWMEYTLFIKNNSAMFNIDNDTITNTYWWWDSFDYPDWVVKFIVDTDYVFKTIYAVWNNP